MTETPLNVVIDGRPLVGHRSGIGVHVAEIAGRLRLAPPPLIATHAAIDDRSGIEHCRTRVDSAPNGVLWQQLILPRLECDVFWGPHGTLPLTLRKPGVITIHDFSSITMPLRHRWRTVLSFNLFIGRSIERAAKIACVSRSVADATMRGFGAPASSIVIVPNGVDEFFSPGDGGSRDYILYAGTIEPRKGIDDLLAVWGALPRPRPRLVLAGARGWGRVTTAGAEQTGYVSREQLRELYRGARAFVYPSHFEGFGMPPLEAMACGTPVIATRTGAIPEYAEGAALLVPPADRNALSAALRRLLADRTLEEELRAAGPPRARLHGWEPSTRTMETILREAAS